MSVYLIGQNPLPDVAFQQGKPCDRHDDGPNGWSRFVRTMDGQPDQGKTLCAVVGSETAWVYLEPGDPNNGQWAIVEGTIAAFNPEPGGPVRAVFVKMIPNA